MVKFNMRKTVAVLAAVATLGVAGPVAVTAANAADAPETDAATCVKEHSSDARMIMVTFCKPDGTSFASVGNYRNADENGSNPVFSAYSGAVSAPEVKGKVFDHWANAGSTEAVDENMPVDFDMAVYPVYKDAPVEYIYVFFRTQGDEAAPLQVVKGSTWAQVKGQAPTVKPGEGQEFKGWSLTQGGPVLQDGDVLTDAQTYLYPVLADKPAPVKVSLAFYDNEDSNKVFTTVSLEEGSTFSQFAEIAQKDPNFKIPQGKKLAGWYFYGATDLVDGSWKPEANSSYAVYPRFVDAAVNHTVTFNDWANWDGKVSFNDGRTHLFHEYQDALKYEVQVPKGYDFAGWSEDANHKDVDHLVDSLKEVLADMQVYPVFVPSSEQPTPAKVNVAFHDNQGNVIANIDGTSGDSFDAFTAKLAARNITAPAVPGQEFVAWSVKGGAATPELVTADLDVYPAYKATPKPQPQYPWWAGWWGGFQHWWGSWNQWFGGWWR